LSRSEQRELLARCKARIEREPLYPSPVRLEHVRILTTPWLFRLPWFRRFDGYTMWDLILIRSAPLLADETLIAHELCHVWQMQHHPIRMPLSYLRLGYSDNPYEAEARRASEPGPAGV
jgi:hypothetical protein